MHTTILTALLWHLWAPLVCCAPYILTTYVQYSVYTASGYTISGKTTIPPRTYTYTEDLEVTATSLPPALETVTEYRYASRLTVVQIALPSGAGREPSENFDSTAIRTSYYVPITYSQPTTCLSTTWQFVSTVPVYPPSPVASLFTPVTKSTSTTTYTYTGFETYVAVIAVLNPTDLNSEDLVSASSANRPYVYSCRSPTPYTAGSYPTSTYTPSSYYGSSRDYGLLSTVQIIIIVVCVWIAVFFVLGLVESWIKFRGLMLGKRRRRGVPILWCCISFWCLCFVGPEYDAKSPEEQQILLERWQAMSAGEKLRLWLAWGFRWKYPPMLGAEPTSSRRGRNQT